MKFKTFVVLAFLYVSNFTLTAQDSSKLSVTVNSEVICADGIATIVATPSLSGNYKYTWTVPDGVTNPGDVQSFTTSIEGDYTVVIKQIDFLCNLDFEANQIVSPNNYIITDESNVPCWSTTATDSQIEVWGDEFLGINAYSGNQFIELNANVKATLFQNFKINSGALTEISFAHRGRSGDEIMEVEIGPVGGPYESLGQFTDGQSWGFYQIAYTFPNTTAVDYSIRFKSILPDSSMGNLLDNISVAFSGETSDPATGSVTRITGDIPTFAQIPSICVGEILELPLTSIEGVLGTWSPEVDNTTTTTYTFTPAALECTSEITTLEIVVNPIVTPTFNVVAAICAGESLANLPTTSLNDVAGTWSPAVDNTATTTYTFTPAAEEICAASVTLEIVVNPIITPTFNDVAAICAGESLTNLPTTSLNGVAGTWSPAVNNTATTTYTFTPSSGQCAETANLDILIIPTINPIFTSINPICSGDIIEALPITSLNNVKGTWSPALNNTETTVYTFTPDIGQGCTVPSTLIITVNSIVDIAIKALVKYTVNDQIIEVLVEGGSGNYEYRMDMSPWQDSRFFNDLTPSKHIITVREKSNCSNEPTTSVVLVKYSNFFTPNGDGINDTWSPKGLEDQLDARIDIFDRYGKIIYSGALDGTGWDGFYGGKIMPATDYWFQITYLEAENTPRVLRMHFSLVR